MHTVRLKLKTNEYDCHILEKRFHALSHVHNVMVKHGKALLKKLSCNSEYAALRDKYQHLPKGDDISSADKKRKKQLSAEMNAIIRSYGLSKYNFEAYLKVCGARYSKCLSSQQVQKEAGRVWAGVEKILYGSGKELHFKKYRDFETVCGKSNTNGAKFNTDSLTVEWLGLNLKCKLPKNSTYITEALNADVSYCEIQRKMFPNGWHYYANIYLKGDAPRKNMNIPDRSHVTGIDIGTSTVAAVSDNTAVLKELAPDCKKYNAKIIALQQSMDISKHISNPSKYKADGTIDKHNHDRWVFSNTYLKNRNRLKSLYRQKSAYIKQFHEETVKELLTDSVYFVTEEMCFKGLAKRSSKTERSETASNIKQKDGVVRKIHKFKRKKRFGKSLNNRAPAMFIQILKRKAELYGGGLYEVNTKAYRASQYNHATDEYVKCSLSERTKLIDGHTVQRDLYSAFLLKNCNSAMDAPDRDKCIYEFDGFLKVHNRLVAAMMEHDISMKQCFGF